MKIQICKALAALLLIAGPLLAQEHPNLARGFESGKQYDFGNLDSVNLFSGSLTLTIPLGGAYSVNGALAYHLSLVYNSSVWDYQTRYDSPSAQNYVQALPRESTNAGLGWQLSLGRLYAPGTPGNKAYKWMYLGPDGGQHLFFGTLHEDDPAAAGVCYSRDSGYLRLTGVGDCALNSSALAAEIEFPDGTIRRFTRASTVSPFRIVQIRDRFNNQVNIDYSVANQWLITDGHRTQKVLFTTRPSGMVVVDQVVLSAFGGTTATYGFNYTDVSIARSCKDNDPQTSASLNVSLLTSLSLPEGLTYSMLDATGTAPAYNTACDTVTKDLPGTIQRITLPTLGSMEWQYRTYQFVDAVLTLGPYEDQIILGKSAGVSTKTIKNPNGNCYGGGTSCTWTYTPKGRSTAPFERSTTVTTPLGDETVYWFDDNPYRRQYDGWQYGLPMRVSVTDGAGRYLSQEIYAGPVATGVKKRSVYVRYEHDKFGYPANTENYYNSNRRLESQRIVYEDDAGRYADINYSGFDGLGHYRTAATDGNFGAGDVRTTFTGYNPDAFGNYLVYKIDPTTNAPAVGHTFAMIGAGSPWMLETFAEQTVSEGGAIAKNEFCFDTATGFLLRKRILANGTARAAKDVLMVLTPSIDGRGNLGNETWYGGDTQAIGTGALCALAPPANNQYRVDYTYQYGSLSTAQYYPFNFKTADYAIDANTGLPRSSNDMALLTTNLEYDKLGRVTWEKPTTGQGAWVQHIYTPATVNGFAQTGTYAWPNGTIGGQPALTATQVTFDRFGRVAEESLLMPGSANSYSTRTTKYNALGWKTSVSELGTAANVTSFLGFDPFGRPTTLRPPDGSGHDVTVSYAGVRTITRTLKIGTTWNGTAVTESNATSTETYDRQGRLWQVTEPAGGTSATYGYNVLGLLSSAAVTGGATTQTRLFNYDNRGFLTSEQHPEKGVAGNGVVSYFNYDARGHATRRVDGPNDLTFTLDRAERVTNVRVTGTPFDCAAVGARCIKTFTYADSNLSGDWRRGKLTQAVRYNYPVLGVQHTVLLTDLYTYGGKAGRASNKETRLTYDGTTTEDFQQSYVYDDIGQVTSLTYPNCAFAACPSSPRTVTYGYANGWLTSVPGWASSISYHPNGMLNQIAHSNGLVLTQSNDPNGIERPSQINAVLGMTTLWTTGPYAFDGAGNPKTIGNQRFLHDLVGRLTEGQAGNGTYQKYAYDAFGNITSLDTTGTVINTPTNPQTNHLNAPSTYDGAANLTGYNGAQYEYDELNMLRHFKSGAEEWLYMYTADDERMWSFKVGANPRFDRFALRDLSGHLLREYSNANYTWGNYEDYIYRDSKLLAAAFSSGAQRHFDLDHLGSVRLVTDAFGTQLGFHRYFPFGKENTTLQEAERMKFAGHERDLGDPAGDGDDLDYMHARFFSPLNGRFLSFDPAGGDPSTPQSWNRFAYAMDAPLKYTDPQGLLPDDPVAAFAGEITVTDNGKPGPLLLWQISWMYPRPGAFVMNGGRGENLDHDAYVRAIAKGVWEQAGWVAVAADRGAQAFDYVTGYVSATDALIKGNPSEAIFLGALAVIPGPLDNAAGAALRGFRPGKWLSHFEKHGAEMGFKTSVEYLRGANRLISGSKGVDTFVRANGDRLFYRKATNEFAVLAKDGYIRTYYLPTDGEAYWLKQIGK